MKKIALIVLLAVVASRILSEHDDRHGPNAPQPFSIVGALWDDDQPAPAPPHPPSFPALRTFALPPTPAEPEAIRTVPWHGQEQAADHPTPLRRFVRGKRSAPRDPAPPASSVPAPATKGVPAWFPRSELDEETLARADDSGSRVLIGRLSASEERARADLRKIVSREIADWLAADVPMDWVPPQKLVDRMVRGTYVQTVVRGFGPTPGETPATTTAAATGAPPSSEPAAALELDDLYTLYRAGQKLDFSSRRRDELVRHYHRDVASARMKRSGGVIGVVLVGLALISFYVRADEATKGYYTNRLRVLALAGLGAAGAAAYRYLV